MRNGRSRRSALAIAGALALGFFALLGSLVLVLRATPSPAPAPVVILADAAPLDVAVEFARLAARPRATMMVSDGYGMASPPPAVPFAPGLLGDEAFTLEGTMAEAFLSDDYRRGPLVDAEGVDGSWKLSDGARQPVGDSSSTRAARQARSGAATSGVPGASGGSFVPASRTRSSASTSGDVAAEVSGDRLRLSRIPLQGDGIVASAPALLTQPPVTRTPPALILGGSGQGGDSFGDGQGEQDQGGQGQAGQYGITLASVSSDLQQSVAPELFAFDPETLVALAAEESIPTPEPASLVLLGSGLAATAWRMRRRRVAA